MWKYWLAIFLIGFLLISSTIFRIRYQKPLKEFNPGKVLSEMSDERLYIFAFFSLDSCPYCLEFIEVLNNLSQELRVIGFIPDKELKSEKFFREQMGVQFKLLGQSKASKFIPNFIPSIVGTNNKGTIYFVLPGIPNQKEFLSTFLVEFNDLIKSKFKITK